MVPFTCKLQFLKRKILFFLQIFEVFWGFLNFSCLDADYESTIGAHISTIFCEIFKTNVQFWEILEARTLLVDNLSLYKKQTFTREIKISSTKSKFYEKIGWTIFRETAPLHCSHGLRKSGGRWGIHHIFVSMMPRGHTPNSDAPYVYVRPLWGAYGQRGAVPGFGCCGIWSFLFSV